MTPEREIIFCEFDDDVADAAAELIFEAQESAIADRGVFRIALAGGSTPKMLYERLASPEWIKKMDWGNWEIFWGDERAVPPTNPDSNFKLADETLLSKISAGEIWRMPGEESDLNLAAEEYARTLRSRFSHGTIEFDVILLGMGTDGHTASLFPKHSALKSEAVVEAVETDQKIPKRLTLTLPVINSARNVIFLITGDSKAKMVSKIIDQEDDSLPAAKVLPPDGRCIWILDEDASQLLE